MVFNFDDLVKKTRWELTEPEKEFLKEVREELRTRFNELRESGKKLIGNQLVNPRIILTNRLDYGLLQELTVMRFADNGEIGTVIKILLTPDEMREIVKAFTDILTAKELYEKLRLCDAKTKED